MQISAEITPDAVELAAGVYTQEVGQDLHGGSDSFTCNSEATWRSNYPYDLPICICDWLRSGEMILQPWLLWSGRKAEEQCGPPRSAWFQPQVGWGPSSLCCRRGPSSHPASVSSSIKHSARFPCEGRLLREAWENAQETAVCWNVKCHPSVY